MLIAFQQNNSSNGAVPDPSFFVKGLARETRSILFTFIYNNFFANANAGTHIVAKKKKKKANTNL